MPISESILNKAGEMLGAISPIELFNANQVKKLVGPRAKNSELIGAAFGMIKDNIGKAISGSGMPGHANIGHYFEGYNIGENLSSIADSTVALRKKYRQMAAAGAMVYGGSQLLGGLPARATNFAAQAGIHGVIASALYKVNPTVGIGYAGWGAYNATRSGDNIGPF